MSIELETVKEETKPTKPSKRTSEKKTTAPKKESPVSPPKMTPKATVKKIEKASYDKDDMIPCVNVFPGATTFVGRRTKDVYSWDTLGDVQYVAYQDLRAEMNNRRSPLIYEPIIVIQEPDVYEEYPEISKLYEEVYSVEDTVKALLGNSLNVIETMLETASQTRKGMLKTIALDLITNEELTNIKVIKLLDRELGTDLLSYYNTD